MKKSPYLKYLLLLIFFVFISIGCNSTIPTNLNLENNMVTHFIDVGQGDCILIQVNNKNLLIDSGTAESSSKVIRYLKGQNITKLDYLVATHPHDDHIGGMTKIINKFKVDEFYAPKVTSTSETFKNMVKALKNKNLRIKIAQADVVLDLGPNTTCIMLSPNKTTYKDTNDYSCVIKISYKNSNYLFAADSESLSEKEILTKGYNLKAQVLKVAHHGSNSSTSEEFLNKVSPNIAVISCGCNNNYGHPSKQTLNKLKKFTSTIYRTDLDKNIILISNGTNIEKYQTK